MFYEKVPANIGIVIAIEGKNLGADVGGGVRTGFDQEDRMSGSREVRGDRSSTWTAAGDDIVVRVCFICLSTV